MSNQYPVTLPPKGSNINFSKITQSEISFGQQVFNIEKTDYYKPKLFSGEAPGVFNTLHQAHPEIERLFKLQKTSDWDEQETLEGNDNKLQFKVMAPYKVEPMKRTLGFQWETDTTIGRTLAIFGAFAATNDQLFEIYMRIADNENLHARTYSEIIKSSFDDIEAVLTDILNARETLQRLAKAGAVFTKMRRTLCEVELGLREKDEQYYQEIYLFIVTVYCVERIQFLSSFAITFCYGQAGHFIEIANSVRLICRDEYEIHVKLGKYIVQKFAEDAITVEAKALAFPQVKEIIDEIREAEHASLNYQLETVAHEGLFGFSVDDFRTWVDFCCADVYKTFGITPDFEVPKNHRLPYMNDWTNNDNFQQSPQEENSVNYRLLPMSRDDRDVVFACNF